MGCCGSWFRSSSLGDAGATDHAMWVLFGPSRGGLGDGPTIIQACRTLSQAAPGWRAPGDPGVEVGALRGRAPPPLTRLIAEQRRDPAPRVGRVNHVVDLAVGGHIHALTALIRRRDRRVEHAVALGFIGDRLELATHP